MEPLLRSVEDVQYFGEAVDKVPKNRRYHVQGSGCDFHHVSKGTPVGTKPRNPERLTVYGR